MSTSAVLRFEHSTLGLDKSRNHTNGKDSSDTGRVVVHVAIHSKNPVRDLDLHYILFSGEIGTFFVQPAASGRS